MQSSEQNARTRPTNRNHIHYSPTNQPSGLSHAGAFLGPNPPGKIGFLRVARYTPGVNHEAPS